MSYEKCREILLRECELVQNAAVIQEKIRISVTDRELDGLEGYFMVLNDIESELAALENKREKLFSGYAVSGRENDPKGIFYAMACSLPENQRNDLTSIYRSLKLESLKLRMANDSLMNYLSGIRATLAEFFAVAFPERGGKMYTPQGTHHSHDMRSMLLNQRF
jgi:hypothetical protein